MLPINKILNGDALTHLKELPSESIDCVMSSPPYWALRNYGDSMQCIWDGQKNCEHEFVIKERFLHRGSTDVENSIHGAIHNENLKVDWKTSDGFCQKCGAWKGQLGLEPTIDLFIEHLCNIFDEVKRVLKKTGTCFVNLGDTYWGGGNNRGSSEENLSNKQFSNRGARGQNQREWGKNYPVKSLCMIPERFAIEMINRGWILRNKIIWHKPNVMPSSVKDRFTVDFENLFFFVKNKKYYFETQYENLAESSMKDARLGKGLVKHKKGKSIQENSQYSINGAYIGTKIPYAIQPREKDFVEYRNLPDLNEFSRYINEARGWKKITIDKIEEIMNSQAPHHWFNAESYPSKEDYLKLKEILGFGDFYDEQMTEIFTKSSEKQNAIEYGRNKRTVWRITTKPFKESHFAVFPEELCETPISAGCPEFVCKKCGKARKKILEPTEEYAKLLNKSWTEDTDKSKDLRNKIGFQANSKKVSTTADYRFKGYSDCNCNVGFSPGVVLDPFFGSGTVGLVALKQGKNFIGIELNPEYIKIAEKRLKPFLEQKELQ